VAVQLRLDTLGVIEASEVTNVGVTNMPQAYVAPVI
jgi:hypothetical protein